MSLSHTDRGALDGKLLRPSSSPICSARFAVHFDSLKIAEMLQRVSSTCISGRDALAASGWEKPVVRCKGNNVLK